MNENFRKYVDKYNWGWKILTVLGISLVILFIVFWAMGSDVELIGLAVFPGITIISLIPLWTTNSFLKKIDACDESFDIQADFDNARDVRGGSVKLGDKWFFMKHKHRVVAYTDVKQVYQYIQKRYFIEVERSLRYVDANGRTRTMCKLDLRGKSDEEVKQIMLAILSHNPNVKLGYK